MADKTEILSDRGRGRGQDSGQCEPEPGDATLSRGPRRGPGGSRRVSPTVQYIHITDMNVSNTLQRSYVKLVIMVSSSVAIMINTTTKGPSVHCWFLFVKWQVNLFTLSLFC